MEVTRKILAVGNSAGTQGKGSLLNSTDGSTSVLLKVTGKGKGHFSPKTSNRRAVHICGPVASFPDFIHSSSKYLTVHFFSARH